MIRVAAVGDLHVGEDGAERWRDALEPVSRDADLLLLAGDLTRVGAVEEAPLVMEALSRVSIPTFAVLGNPTTTAVAKASWWRSSASAACRCWRGSPGWCA